MSELTLVHAYLHSLFVWTMQVVQSGGYAGVILLMAIESSIIPLPSELVIPPAAFWASQGKLSMPGVVLAGAFGSWVGAAICYWLSVWLGRPLVMRYGKWFLMPAHKLEIAERWAARYGHGGIFFARVLPVIRHLISIPAGVLRMEFGRFSLMTLLGAGLWCAILAAFGPHVITAPMLDNPEEMMRQLKQQEHWILALVLLMMVLYGAFMYVTKRGGLESDAARPAA